MRHEPEPRLIVVMCYSNSATEDAERVLSAAGAYMLGSGYALLPPDACDDGVRVPIRDIPADKCVRAGEISIYDGRISDALLDAVMHGVDGHVVMTVPQAEEVTA